MRRHPTELEADDRQERRAEQRQDASRADPMKQSIGQRVADDGPALGDYQGRRRAA